MRNFKLITAILLTLMLFGCNQETSESSTSIDKEAIAAEIMNVWENYADAAKSGDLDRAMSYYADDCIQMPMYGFTQDFQQAKEHAQNMFNMFNPVKYEVQQTEIFVYDNMAYEFASIEMDMINKTNGDTISNNFRTFTVWKKVDDGTWKIYRSLGQS